MLFIWIILYSFLCIVGERASLCLGLPHALTVPLIALYWAALLYYLYKKKRLQKYAIALPTSGMRGFASCIPFLLMPALNLLFSTGLTADFLPFIFEALFFILCAFSEEALFRGYLLSLWSEKEKVLQGLITVSILFAALHAVNLFSGSSTSYLLVQCACAGAVGFGFGAVAIRERSILPCAAVHALMNLTASGGTEQEITVLQSAAYLCTAAICLTYGIWLYQNINFENRGERT